MVAPQAELVARARGGSAEIEAGTNVFDVHSSWDTERRIDKALRWRAVTYEELKPVAESPMQRDVRSDDEARRLR